MTDKIYLANGLGFSSATRCAVVDIKARLEKAGLQVFEPFFESKDLGEKIVELQRREKNVDMLKKKLADINKIIGHRNAQAIDAASVVVAVLDGGLELDSGVAAEIGYAAGRGKKILGYRTDFRCGGENPGATINIQVEFFLKQYGGAIFTDLDVIIEALKRHPRD
nr:nucleoside 2-deoxyribosyltransferase [Candidatus Sigynarchaeota archaeon]